MLLVINIYSFKLLHPRHNFYTVCEWDIQQVEDFPEQKCTCVRCWQCTIMGGRVLLRS